MRIEFGRDRGRHPFVDRTGPFEKQLVAVDDGRRTQLAFGTRIGSHGLLPWANKQCDDEQTNERFPHPHRIGDHDGKFTMGRNNAQSW